jgi:ornithine decarboxylase
VKNFESVGDYLKVSRPDIPVLCHRPHAARRAAAWFVKNFPGDVLYAVKANPSPLILDALYESGIRHFDIASLQELELVRHYKGVRIYCMNTVKHPEHIRRMYFDYGVRDFSLDCIDELDKIVEATQFADDLCLHVRIAVDNSESCFPLDKKFGVPPSEAPELLIRARTHSEELGVCFHVGSQAMNPQAYAQAIDRANHLISKAGVIVDSLDVGGGFPAAYPGMDPQALAEYVRTIDDAFNTSRTTENCRLRCEPGRALVAESASVLVNVTLRKGKWLYLNDGSYGSLFDAAHISFPFPMVAMRDGDELSDPRSSEFSFYGPTCDSIDAMKGPYPLPESIRAGDYIEIGQLGAYGDTLRTNFNGFGGREEIIVTDEPMLSMFAPRVITPRPEQNAPQSNIIYIDA